MAFIPKATEGLDHNQVTFRKVCVALEGRKVDPGTGGLGKTRVGRRRRRYLAGTPALEAPGRCQARDRNTGLRWNEEVRAQRCDRPRARESYLPRDCGSK